MQGKGESKSQITASLRVSVLPERGKDVIGGAVRSSVTYFKGKGYASLVSTLKILLS